MKGDSREGPVKSVKLTNPLLRVFYNDHTMTIVL